MHGRVKKDIVEPTPEEKAKQREQVRTARSLFAKLLDLRKSQTYNDQALEMTSKALQFHPEFPTLWGYRRELLTSTGSTEKPLQELLKMEMKLLEKALRKSQKVYSIWFHRKWVVERLFQEMNADEEAIRNLLSTELDLCNQLLAVDERNFHCWNHRMNLMDLMRTWGKDKSNSMDLNAIDLKLSTDLINQNFSNYSAWHLRTLLQQPLAGEEPRMKLNVEEELEWVQQGIYTEPNDQSVWLYHQWLTLEHSQLPRITHCAILDGEFFIFFSRPVCASVATVGTVRGCLEAIPRSALKRTRPRSVRRSWSVGWRFLPETEAKFRDEVQITVTLESCGTGLKQSMSVFNGQPFDLDTEMSSNQELKCELSEEKKEILKSELMRIDELLEIEPDCRWALLARMRLQLASSPPEEATLSSCLSSLERMSSLDPLRRNFYADSKADALMMQSLTMWSGQGRKGDLKLVGLGLKNISPTAAAFAFGVRILRLDENELHEFGPLLGLLSLIELSVSKNQIRGDVAEIFALKRLQYVDLSWNYLSANLGCWNPPEKLQKIDLSGNTNVTELGHEKLSQLFPTAWKLQFGEGKCLAHK